MNACLETAESNGNRTIWLGVWERNELAIGFYEKWGFAKVGTKEFRLGERSTDRLHHGKVCEVAPKPYVNTDNQLRIERAMPDAWRTTRRGALLGSVQTETWADPGGGGRAQPCLADTFNLDRVVIARDDEGLLGLAGVQFAKRAFVGMTWAAMRGRYGVFRGAYKMALLAVLDRENAAGELVMDGIVVAESARGRGIGDSVARCRIGMGCGGGHESGAVGCCRHEPERAKTV